MSEVENSSPIDPIPRSTQRWLKSFQVFSKYLLIINILPKLLTEFAFNVNFLEHTNSYHILAFISIIYLFNKT